MDCQRRRSFGQSCGMATAKVVSALSGPVPVSPFFPASVFRGARGHAPRAVLQGMATVSPSLPPHIGFLRAVDWPPPVSGAGSQAPPALASKGWRGAASSKHSALAAPLP